MASTQLTLNQTTLLGATTGTISCLLAPLAGKQLLLPSVTVAEVVAAHDLKAAPSGSPAWKLGAIRFQETDVPVISFEVLNGQALPNKIEHIAIVNSISGQRDLPRYGVVVQGSPRLAKVKIAELEDLESAPVGPVEFLQVRYSGELAVIPDLDSVESQLLAN